MKNVARLIDEKARERKSSSGTSGCGRVAIRIGKAIKRHDADGDRDPGRAVGPFVRLAADHAERQAADRERGDERAEPVEPPGRLGVARFLRRGRWSPTARMPSSGTLIRKATRQPSVSTRLPPTIGPRMVSAAVDAAQIPNARPALGAIEGVGDERQRAGDEQRAGGALGEAEDDQPLERRRQAAQGGGGREADQADGVDAPPAVVVGQRAGQDQQRGEDREVAADDVGLALEDADQRPRQLLADVLERRVDDGPVEEDRAGADDGADQGPALS